MSDEETNVQAIVEEQTTVVVNEKFKTKILSNNYLDIQMIKGN